jgi:hypothetical protein
MRDMRRRFAIGLAAGIFLAAGAELLFAQKHARLIVQQQPAHAPVIGIGKNAAQLEPKAARAAMLLQNEKEFREGVEQLYVLVNELKEEVEKTRHRMCCP